MPTLTASLARRLLLFAPLLAVVVPAWMAWNFTCLVPHADHWFCVADPYVHWVDGASLWSQLHAQGNDSRLDAMRLLGFMLIKLTSWDLRIESLTCVALGALIAWGAVRILLRYFPGGPGWTLITGALTVGLVLTPHQWMNWTFGVQTCYMLVVLFTLLVLLCFESPMPLGWRTLLAGACAFVATHSFVNGWLSWVLGSLCLARALMMEKRTGWQRGGPAALWLIIMSANVAVYFQGYGPGTSVLHETPLAERLMADPMSFVAFFVRVLSAAFSDYGIGLNREERLAMNARIATGLSVVALVLFVAVVWAQRRALFREQRTASWIFLMLCLLGLGNAVAVALARTGVVLSGPFQNRYIAYTLWFHVGLLALLGLTSGRVWAWVRGVWLLVLTAGFSVGFFEGIQDGHRDFNRNQIMTAAAMLRHAAVEPLFLDAVNPGTGPSTIGRLDKLEMLGLLHVRTLRSEKVTDATIASPARAKGMMRGGDSSDNVLNLRGWALEIASKDLADAIVVSAQPEGGEEIWLGIAQRRVVESKLHDKHKSCAQEKRLGWSYTYGDTGDKPTVWGKALPFAPKPLPKGNVTFRAYALDVPDGVFTRLDGSFTAEIR